MLPVSEGIHASRDQVVLAEVRKDHVRKDHWYFPRLQLHMLAG